MIDTHTYKSLKQALLQNLKPRYLFQTRPIFFGLLFIIGIIYWILFFNAGNLTLDAYDWVKESAYLNSLRDAQIDMVIPWKWSEPFYHNTQSFLANPEIVLTPDIILLRWIPNSFFIILHIIIFYSVGFFGSILIAKKLNISLISFFVFWLVFNFNGYLTAHIAVGHFQWTGYFLIPFFLIILSKFLMDSQNTSSVNITNAFSMAILLGVLFLNGSLHIAVWCCMFMTIALFARWAMFSNVATAIIMGCLLSFGRLLPAALWFPHNGFFIAGYPSFGTFLDAFIISHRHDFTMDIRALGWWEYDVYIGYSAFIILGICFVFALFRKKVTIQIPFLVASGVFLLLSFGNSYNIITKIIPYALIERVSSRFIVMPFILFLITAMIGLDEFFSLWPKSSKVAILIVLPFVVIEIFLNSIYWRVNHLEQSFLVLTRPILSLTPNYNQTYAVSVYLSWSVSFLSLIIILVLLFRNRLTGGPKIKKTR